MIVLPLALGSCKHAGITRSILTDNRNLVHVRAVYSFPVQYMNDSMLAIGRPTDTTTPHD
jgi:hypothetical protein